MDEQNVLSISGGKDSTAMLLLAIERDTPNMQAVFADTGHEHPLTYEYVAYLNAEVFPIRTIRADYTKQLEGRRRMMQRVIAGEHKERVGSKYEWTPEIAREALEYLHTTGVPFLDMCLVHGRFPSTRVRFCSSELKRDPMIQQVQRPLLLEGCDVVSWQGVRADESIARRELPERECKEVHPVTGAEMWNYRPILQWTVDDVFAMHRKHGIEPNPLYKLGMGRVGCMPCIHANKAEILEISRRFPEEFERVAKWESIIRKVSKTSSATFFAMDKTGHVDGATSLDMTAEKCGIEAVVEWAKTARGGKQYDMFRVHGEDDDGPLCTSLYGLCE
jgi:3'-phosphoadenosine 5'-phosphosulfate sulfotransferase (PAPS reductase)/FAD synthetase